MRILALLALLFAVGCPIDLTIPDKPPRGSVIGKVSLRGDGPTEGIDVKLVTATGSRSTQQTDAAGAFTFSDLAQGAYFVEIRRDGFEPFLLPGVEVLGGDPTDVGVLTLEPRTERVTLLGKVIGAGGTIPEGAHVELISRVSMQRESVSITAADGTFLFSVRPGTYTLRASHPLYITTDRPLAELVPGPAVDLTADPLSLPLNPATLTGRVLGEVDGTNTPLAKSQVLVTLDTGETSTTDSMGLFTFTGLAGGPRQVRCSVADFSDERRAITLAPGQNATLPDVTLALRRGVIQGTVTLNDLQPAQDVTVALTGAGAYSATTVPDGAVAGLGHFRIDRVPNGTYEVTATKSRYSRAVQSSVQVTDATPTATIGPLALTVLVGEFRIDDGDPTNAEGFTRNRAVTLQLNAFAGADDFRAWETDAGTFIPFTGLNQPFTLGAAQGRHSVSAQYRRMGTESPTFQSSIVLDSLAPTGGTVEINGGELFTNNPLSLSLRLTASDPTTATPDVSGLGTLRLSLSPTTNASDAGALLTGNPLAYARDLSFSLPQPQVDGPVTVYSQFLDNAGNPSAVVPASITLDRVAPQNVTLSIRDGAQATAIGFTNNGLVQLDHGANLNAEPDGGYVLYKISNSSTALDPTPWQPLTSTSSWFLEPGGADLKTVFARFRDAAGNQTSVVQAQITWDSTPPAPVSLTLLSSSPTNDAGVTLQLAATDTNGLSPSAAVTVAEDPLFSRDVLGPMAMPGTSQLVYRLADVQGAHQVLVRYTDRAGNSASASVTVVLDTLAPGGAQLLVGNQDLVQTGASFPITFVGAPADVTQMVVTSAAPNCATATYQGFAPNSVLPLSEGNRQVYACLKDAAGNTAALTPVSITVDNTAPVAGTLVSTGPAFTRTAAVPLHFTGITDGTGSGVDSVRVSTDSAFSGVPFVPATPSGGTFDYNFVLPPGDGPRTIYAQVRDQAGLVSTTVQTTVTLDTQEPVWTSAVAQLSYVTLANATLLLQASDNIDTPAQLLLAVSTTGVCPVAGYAAFSNSFPVSALVDGVNTLTICLKDRAGNVPPVTPTVQVRRISTGPSAANLVPNVPLPLASGALISWTDTNLLTKRIEVDAALDAAFTQSPRTYIASTGSCVVGNEVSPVASARVGLQPVDLPLTNLRNWFFRLRAINCADAASANVTVPGSVLPNLSPTPTEQSLAHGQLVADGAELWLHAAAVSAPTRVELMRFCRVGVSDCRNEASWTALSINLNGNLGTSTRPATLFNTDTHWYLTDVITNGSASRLAIASCNRSTNCTLPTNWTVSERRVSFNAVFTNPAGAASSSALAFFYVRRDAALGSVPYLSLARCERSKDCTNSNGWVDIDTPIRVDPNEPLTVTASDNQFFIGALSESAYGAGPPASGPTAAGQPMLVKCEQLCTAVTPPPNDLCNGLNCGCDGYVCGDFRFSRLATPVGAEVLQSSAPVIVSSNGQKTAAWFERRCVGTSCTDAIKTSTCLAADCLYGTDYTPTAALAQWPGVNGGSKARFSLTASGTRELNETLRLSWMDTTTGATTLASCTTSTLSACFNTVTRAQLSTSDTMFNAVAVGRDSYFVGTRQLGQAALWQPIVPSPLQFVVGPRANALEISWTPYEASNPSLLRTVQLDGGADTTVSLPDPFTTSLTIPSASTRLVSLAFTNSSGRGDDVRWATTPFTPVPAAAADPIALPAVSLGAPGFASSNLNGFVYAAWSSVGGLRLGRCDTSGDCRVSTNWTTILVDLGAGFAAVQLAVDYPREHSYGPRAGMLGAPYSTPRLFLTAMNAGALTLYGCVLTTPTACATSAAFTKVRLDQGALPAVALGALPSLSVTGDHVMVTESTAGDAVVVRFCDAARYPQQTCNPSYPSPPPSAQTNQPLGFCFSAANWQAVTISEPSHGPAVNGTGSATSANPGSPQQAVGLPHAGRGYMVVQPQETGGFLFMSCNYALGDSGCAPAAKNNCALAANWKPVVVSTGGSARYVDLFSSDGNFFPTRGMSEQSAGVYVSFWDALRARWGVAQCKFEPSPLYDAPWVCSTVGNLSAADSVAWSQTTVVSDVPGTPASSTIRVVGGDLFATFSMTDRTFVARCSGGQDCMLRTAWNTYAVPQVYNTLNARSTLAGGLTGDLVLGLPERDGGVTLLSGGRFNPQ